MTTTNSNRIDARTIGNVLIMAILLVAGVLLVGKVSGFVSDLWHGEPFSFGGNYVSHIRPVESYDQSIGKTYKATSETTGATVEYSIVGMGNQTAQVLTTDDDGANVLYRCPLGSLGNLDAMAKNCTDATGNFGEAKEVRNTDSQPRAAQAGAPRAKRTPSASTCETAKSIGVSCEDMDSIGVEYFRINHPEVLPEDER